MNISDVMKEYYSKQKSFRSELNIAKLVAERYILEDSDKNILEWIEHELRYNALPDNGISTTHTVAKFANDILR